MPGSKQTDACRMAVLRTRLGLSRYTLATMLACGETTVRGMETEVITVAPVVLEWLERRVRDFNDDPPPRGWQRRDTSPRALRPEAAE